MVSYMNAVVRVRPQLELLPVDERLQGLYRRREALDHLIRSFQEYARMDSNGDLLRVATAARSGASSGALRR